jgi:hypothetical protein
MKIKNNILENLIGLTECEWKLFEYLVRRQDEKGFIYGVHNKSVCQQMKMSKQSFYNSLRGLAKKNIITYVPGTTIKYTPKRSTPNNIDDNTVDEWDGLQPVSIDFNVTIIGNDFSYEGANNEGYVSLQRKLFRSKEFKNLKSNEKFLVFWFAHITNEKTQSYKRKIKEFYAQYSKMLNVSKRAIHSYIENIKDFFNISLKRGILYIKYNSKMFKKDSNKNTKTNSNYNFVEALARQMRIKKASQKQIRDTAALMKQYEKSAETYGSNIKGLIIMALSACARLEKKQKNKELIPEYVHSVIRTKLSLIK